MTCLEFDQTDRSLPDSSRDFDLVATFSRLNSIFFVFFFLSKITSCSVKKHKVLLFYYVNIQCASYKLVTFIWTSLRVNPARMKSALLEMTIKMLDIIHHPCHFNASLKCQMTLRLHLPPRARRSSCPTLAGCDVLLMMCHSTTKGWSEPRM